MRYPSKINVGGTTLTCIHTSPNNPKKLSLTHTHTHTHTHAHLLKYVFLGLIETKRTNCLLHFIFVIYVTPQEKREREREREKVKGDEERS
jgi:hypothetical protein